MGKYRFEDLSQDDLRKLVASLEDCDIPIFLVDPDAEKRVIFANTAWTSHANRLHNNLKAGVPVHEAIHIETKAIGSQFPPDIQKQIATDFADTVLSGGIYEFGAPDGKLFRGSYTRSNKSQILGISFDVTETKMRRAEAKRAKKALDATLEGLHHGVMLYDKTGHVSYFNESFRSTAESLGIQIAKNMFHIELRNQLPADLQQRLVNDERADLGDFEFLQQAPNGKHYLFESRRLSNKTTLVSTVDVTELQENRAEKKKIRKTLEKTLGGLDHGVMLVDMTGHVAYCNESQQNFARQTGANIEVGMHFSEIRKNVPHQDPNGQTAENGDYAYTINGDNGGTYMVKRRYLENIGMLVSTVDITELNNQKAETQRLSAMFEKALEGLPHGVLLYDREGNVLFHNTEFANSINTNGVLLEEAQIKKGMSYKEVRKLLPLSFENEISKITPGDPFELVQKAENGKSFLLEGKSIEGLGFLTTTVDITELQNAMEAAKAADIAKSSFLANMSHEIRTPMNGVLGMAQVLEQTDVSGHQKKCIDIIKSSSELLLRIINDILDISKLDAEKVDLDLRPMNMETAIQSAVEIIKPELQEKPDVEIICQMNGPSEDIAEPWHLGDHGRLRQILINLIGNAVKFTPKGHVKITTNILPLDESSDRIQIRIEDTGIGIPSEKVEKIFDRFEQNDMSTTRVYGGTGLGLSISRKLIESMGGSLNVCPETTVGACFTLELTAQRCDPVTTISARPIRKTYKDIPVLIIDDNDVNHMVLTNQLKPLKVAPFCLSSAKHGLSVLRKMAQKNLPLPLVICDYQMPVQSGYDFVQALRADPLIAQTEVIILTSADITSRRKGFADLGVKYVLEKPCANVELLDVIAESLNKSLFTQKTAADLVPNKTEDPKPVNASFRVLVADDDQINRTVFDGLLNLAGCMDVTLVKNGLEAVQIFSQKNFDLVLMDISMPVLNGMEATEKIRNYERREGRGQTPIIAVTAHALKGDKEKFMDVGMNDYLAKPILKQSFEALIEKWSPYRFEQDSPNALAS